MTDDHFVSGVPALFSGLAVVFAEDAEDVGREGQTFPGDNFLFCVWNGDSDWVCRGMEGALSDL